jgi:hypothetical protein
MKNLRDCGAIGHNVGTGVKLLAGTVEEVRKPIHIELSDFSQKVSL